MTIQKIRFINKAFIAGGFTQEVGVTPHVSLTQIGQIGVEVCRVVDGKKHRALFPFTAIESVHMAPEAVEEKAEKKPEAKK